MAKNCQKIAPLESYSVRKLLGQDNEVSTDPSSRQRDLKMGNLKFKFKFRFKLSGTYIFKFKFEDFTLTDYDHHPHIKGKVAV